jgi:hypothetical protein
MAKWRAKAIELFPEYRKGFWAFQRSRMSLYSIFFELKDDLDQKIETEDHGWLDRVFELVEWCYAQRVRAPDIWNAAATAFLEHMADTDERAKLIPKYVKPPLFEFMREEFHKRRERVGLGKSAELVKEYNAFHGTDY